MSKPGKNDKITFASGVSIKGKPFVHLTWGKNKAQFSPEELREHATGLLEAAMAAELDACLVVWLKRSLGMSIEQAGQTLMLFRKKRETNKVPSVTLNIEGDRMRPDTVRQAAKDLLYMSFSAEMEAFLVDMIINDIGQSGEVADIMIQEFREMRGATTIWPSEKP